jgi:hypothetical protein
MDTVVTEFPVDLVYTWVDGDDQEHHALKQKYSRTAAPDATVSYRFRSTHEIYESIASALTFVPWVRTIYVLVADGQEARFHNQFGSKVQIIPHCVIYEHHLDHLPTFNSQSIECHLHEIPDLAEHFLYANDDTFFGAPLEKAHFFELETGKPRVACSKTHLPMRSDPFGETWQWSRANNFQVLTRVSPEWKQYPRCEWIHQIKALRRSFFSDAWSHPVIAPKLEQTSRARFRSPQDIEPVGLLLHWNSDQDLTAQGTFRSRTFLVNDTTPLDPLFQKLNSLQLDLFCINDGMRHPSGNHLGKYTNYLKHRLPHNGGQRWLRGIAVFQERHPEMHKMKLNSQMRVTVKGQLLGMVNK